MYHSSYMTQKFRRVQRLLDLLQPEASSQALVVPGSPRPRDSIIIFTGSFNPPTIAHLALLKQAQQFARLHQPMRLYAAFSKRTVDKETVERPLLLDRVLLLDKVLRRRFPHAGILLFNRGLYVEQAQAVRSVFGGVKRIFFLMGFDKIVQIFDAHYYEDRDAALTALFQQAELLVAPRGHAGEQELLTLLQQPENQRFASSIHLLPFKTCYREISSTQIRREERVYQQEVPQEVREFMSITRAYAPPFHARSGSEVDYYAERIQWLSRLLGMRVS